MKPERYAWVVLLAALAAPGQVVAQLRNRVIEEPKWLTLRITEASTGVYSEGTYEENTFKSSGTTVVHDRIFVGPTLGINAEGSIYHPNLFRYQINTDGAYGKTVEHIESTTKSSRDEWQYLGQFSGSADILATKPYHTSIFGSHDHAFSEYDFFNQVTVDSTRYGARISYDLGPVYMGARYTHRDEEITGLSRPTITHDDVWGLDLRNDRKRGVTSLNYTYTLYSLTGQTGLTDGSDHAIALSDTERFGHREQFKFNSSIAYNQRESIVENDRELTAFGGLDIEHRGNLSSSYNLNYDRFESGSFGADNYLAQAQLRHQLYQSLTSTLLGQFADNESSDGINTGSTRRYGVGLTEGYSKRLSESHHLRIDNSVLVEEVHQQALGDIKNEPHTFSAGSSGNFFLNQAGIIISSIVVWKADRSITYSPVTDYDVQQIGERILIERQPLGSIADGQSVVVDYRAEPTPPGTYNTVSEFFQIRFDLFKNLWGIYGRLNLFVNDAPETLRVQNLKSYTFGTDLNWQRWRAGAEYIIYDSDQSKYNSARLFQSASFRPDDESSLSIGFTETWTDYISAHRQEQDYRFITRYRRVLTSHLGLETEGGVDLRRGPGVDQTLGTLRAGIDYAIGKFSVKATYNYEYNLFLNTEERQKHMFLIRARRVF